MRVSDFFLNTPATPQLYTLSLHDALPISPAPMTAIFSFSLGDLPRTPAVLAGIGTMTAPAARDRKSTRLNSSHTVISYAVFCLKKKRGKTLGAQISRGAADAQIARHVHI